MDCVYVEVFQENAPGQFGLPPIAAVSSFQVGHTYVAQCTNLRTNEYSRQQFVYDDAAPVPGQPAVTGFDVAQSALATITVPGLEFETSPPHGANQIVGLRTWIWPTIAVAPLSATAAVDGVSATVTATPAALTVDPGDGSPTITCPDFRPPRDPTKPEPGQGCTHLYQRRSTSDRDPNGTYTMTVSVTYDVSWTASTGEGGQLTGLQAVGTRALVVREIQALIN